MTAPDMHTLAGAFALDALDEHERERFQRHLAQCPSCAQEVRELRATAARLGAAVAADPPAEFADRVFAEVRVTRQDPPVAPRVSAGRSRRDRGIPRWAGMLAAAAAVIGLVLAGVSAGIAWNARNDLTVAQQQLDQARERFSPVGDLLAAPDIRVASGEAIPGGSGTVFASGSQDRMMFMGTGLPDHGPDRDYQLWLMNPDGQPRSAGIVPGGAGDGAPLLADDIGGMAKVAMTVEPRGGSPEPTSSPIFLVDLPA